VNITGNLFPHALHVKYNEALSGKASTIEVVLEDVHHAFQDNPPKVGTAMSLAIGYQGMPLTSCGNFEVDEWESDGPPDTFTLKAIQAGLTHALRTPKSMAYEGQTLTSIATTIASRYGMTVLTDAVNPDVVYARLTQRMESDLGFLHRIANAHDYEFKIRGTQLYFYSRTALDSAAPTGIPIDKTNCLRYRIHMQHLGKRSYGSGITTYYDSMSKQLLTANRDGARTSLPGEVRARRRAPQPRLRFPAPDRRRVPRGGPRVPRRPSRHRPLSRRAIRIRVADIPECGGHPATLPVSIGAGAGGERERLTRGAASA